MTLNVSKVVFKTSFWGGHLRSLFSWKNKNQPTSQQTKQKKTPLFISNEFFCIWNLHSPGVGTIKIIEIEIMRYAEVIFNSSDYLFKPTFKCFSIMFQVGPFLKIHGVFFIC